MGTNQDKKRFLHEDTKKWADLVAGLAIVVFVVGVVIASSTGATEEDTANNQMGGILLCLVGIGIGFGAGNLYHEAYQRRKQFEDVQYLSDTRDQRRHELELERTRQLEESNRQLRAELEASRRHMYSEEHGTHRFIYAAENEWRITQLRENATNNRQIIAAQQGILMEMLIQPHRLQLEAMKLPAVMLQAHAIADGTNKFNDLRTLFAQADDAVAQVQQDAYGRSYLSPEQREDRAVAATERVLTLFDRLLDRL